VLKRFSLSVDFISKANWHFYGQLRCFIYNFLIGLGFEASFGNSINEKIF
jgi:hypothetical protein